MEAAAAENPSADGSPLRSEDRLPDGLHRPSRLRDRDPAPAALRREVPPVAARVRPPHVELLGDAVPLRPAPRPSLGPVWPAPRDHLLAPRDGGRLSPLRVRALAPDALRRPPPPRRDGREHRNRAGSHRGLDGAGGARARNGDGRDRVRPRLHLRARDRQASPCTSASPRPVSSRPALSAVACLWAFLRLPETRPGGMAVPTVSLFSTGSLLKAFRRPEIGALMLLSFVTTTAFANFEATFAQFLSLRLGAGPSTVAWFFVFVGVCSVVVQGGLVRRLTPRFGEARLVIGGLRPPDHGLPRAAARDDRPASARGDRRHRARHWGHDAHAVVPRLPPHGGDRAGRDPRGLPVDGVARPRLRPVRRREPLPARRSRRPALGRGRAAGRGARPFRCRPPEGECRSASARGGIVPMTPQTPTSHQLSRDCPAIRIPSGEPVTLKAGTDVFLTQSLGGTLTVQAPALGGLFRISGADGDALGITAGAEDDAPAAAAGPVSEDALWDQLKTVLRPRDPRQHRRPRPRLRPARPRRRKGRRARRGEDDPHGARLRNGSRDRRGRAVTVARVPGVKEAEVAARVGPALERRDDDAGGKADPRDRLNALLQRDAPREAFLVSVEELEGLLGPLPAVVARTRVEVHEPRALDLDPEGLDLLRASRSGSPRRRVPCARGLSRVPRPPPTRGLRAPRGHGASSRAPRGAGRAPRRT